MMEKRISNLVGNTFLIGQITIFFLFNIDIIVQQLDSNAASGACHHLEAARVGLVDPAI